MLLLTRRWGYSGAAGLGGGVTLTSSLCPQLWRISWGLYGPLSGTLEGYHDYLYPAIPLHQIFRRLAVLSSGLTPRWAITASWVVQDVKRKLVSWADFNFTVFFPLDLFWLRGQGLIRDSHRGSDTVQYAVVAHRYRCLSIRRSSPLERGLTHTPRWRRMRCVLFLWSGLAKNRGSGSRSASKLIVGQMWASGALKCFPRVQKRDRKEGGTCGTEQVSLQRCQVYVNATVSDIFVKRRESSADQLGPTNRDKLWLRVVVTELTYVSGFISADTLKPLSFSPSIKEFTGRDNKSFFLVPEVRPESSPDALLHASFLWHVMF